eukprot:3940624-Rhodomonas_salina.1
MSGSDLGYDATSAADCTYDVVLRPHWHLVRSPTNTESASSAPGTLPYKYIVAPYALPVPRCGIYLRACYAMYGTEILYGATRRFGDELEEFGDFERSMQTEVMLMMMLVSMMMMVMVKVMMMMMMMMEMMMMMVMMMVMVMVMVM